MCVCVCVCVFPYIKFSFYNVVYHKMIKVQIYGRKEERIVIHHYQY